MNVYVRVYWLCFLGVGLVLVAESLPELLAGGGGVTTGIVAIGSGLILLSGVVGLLLEETTGAPEEPNALFGLMVLAFLLTLVGFLLEYL